jgi:hypothetical protein
MTAPLPTLPQDTGQWGPGTLKIGPTATLQDVSCYTNSCGLTVSKTSGTPTTKLCGAVKAGVNQYTYQLTGNVDIDLGNDSGLFAYSWDHAGETVDFEFVPDTDLGTSFAGQLVIDPLNVTTAASPTYGGDLTSDFTFDCVGQPVPTYPAGP